MTCAMIFTRDSGCLRSHAIKPANVPVRESGVAAAAVNTSAHARPLFRTAVALPPFVELLRPCLPTESQEL